MTTVKINTPFGVRYVKGTRLEALEQAAESVGLYVRTYSPGDGVTRYRFFEKKDLQAGEVPSSYFGPRSGIYTALGYKEATVYLAGRGAWV